MGFSSHQMEAKQMITKPIKRFPSPRPVCFSCKHTAERQSLLLSTREKTKKSLLFLVSACDLQLGTNCIQHLHSASIERLWGGQPESSRPQGGRKTSMAPAGGSLYDEQICVGEMGEEEKQDG